MQPTLQMLHLMAGGEAKFRERPFMHGGGFPVISPLQYGTGNSEVCLESTKFNGPVWIVVAPLAGALVQAVAEALAGLLLADMVHPRHPVMLGAWPFICDLRNGSFSGGRRRGGADQRGGSTDDPSLWAGQLHRRRRTRSGLTWIKDPRAGS